MPYITHITLTTGDIARQERAGVADDVLAVLVHWLSDALANGKRTLIPGQPGGYSALALQQDGALVVTVYGPVPDIGEPEPLVTIGVASRSRNAGPLWTCLYGLSLVFSRTCACPALPGVWPCLTSRCWPMQMLPSGSAISSDALRGHGSPGIPG